MNRHDYDDRDARDAGDDTQRDELDALLRQWHDDSERRADAAWAGVERAIGGAGRQHGAGAPRAATSARVSVGAVLVSLARRPALRAAAAIVLLVLVATALIPRTGAPALGDTILVPNAGRLEALDEEGNLVGPCALKHTDVDVEVSGPFVRVTVRQDYHNPYQRKIEARYTFPLSHRGAVDRMTMLVGDRVVVGEVHEREEARRIYTAAREQGYVASLLEQERPNIFTQSVANIEPGAEISIEISYVETVVAVDGEFRFHFPMTVAPRYIPGYTLPRRDPRAVPAGFEPREGVTLLGPAKISGLEARGGASPAETARDDAGTITAKTLTRRLHAARPLRLRRSNAAQASALGAGPTHTFEVEYADGAKERGRIFAGGLCEVNGRWCVLAPAVPVDPGTGFSGDTDQVPDAGRITPMPVLPGERAGHDIAVAVTIDTGGPAITVWQSELHQVVERRDAAEERKPGLLHLALERAKEIPNRDFLLRWSIDESEIQEAHFVHRPAPREDVRGRAPVPDPDGYFTLMLRPPARVADEDVRGRELVFVMDSSGSMEGFPIERAQAVMKRAIAAMRPQDVFNVITFNNETDCLWTEPRPADEANRAEAIAYVLARQGGGGTEMKKAVLAALQPAAGAKIAPLTPDELANTPADGRAVAVLCALSKFRTGEDGAIWLHVRDDVRLRLSADVLAELLSLPVRDDRMVELRGTWAIADGRRVLAVDTIGGGTGTGTGTGRLRCVYFLSDGEVGNDEAIVEAVRAHARQTRVFTVAIGNGPNRSLLDAMAKAGRGAADYITLEGDADAVVATFVRRLATPVLTDIELVFDGVEVVDVIPALDEIVDLYDERPLVVHGRYAKPGTGTLTVRGVTGAGPYERVIDLELHAVNASNDVIATHWARAMVDEHMARGDRDAVIALGTSHRLLTKYTSFVAVEKSRVTVGGRPMLVAVPIEMTEGQSWEGTFGWQRRLQLQALDGAPAEDLQSLAQAIDARREREVELRAADAALLAWAQSEIGAEPDAAEVDAKLAAIPKTAAIDTQETRWLDRVLADTLASSARDRAIGGGDGVFAAYKATAGASITAGVPASQSRNWFFANEAGAAGYSLGEAGQAPMRGVRRQAVAADQFHLARDLVGDVPQFGALFQSEGKQLDLERLGDDGAPMREDDLAARANGLATVLGLRGDVGLDDTDVLLLLVGRLVVQDASDGARAVVERVLVTAPDHADASAMRDALADELIDDAARKTRIAEIATRVRRRIDEQIAAWERTARLKQVLDEKLWPVALEPANHTEEVWISILLAERDDDTIAALEDAGVEILGRTATHPIVIGAVAPGKLADVALLEGVRRIEPFASSPDI